MVPCFIRRGALALNINGGDAAGPHLLDEIGPCGVLCQKEARFFFWTSWELALLSTSKA